jgi:DoxX-like protein
MESTLQNPVFARFRIELSLAKVAGTAAPLIPLVPQRLREWAYAGFAINLVSAIIAHLSIRDIPLAFVPSTITSVLWTFSYYFWRRPHDTGILRSEFGRAARTRDRRYKQFGPRCQ